MISNNDKFRILDEYCHKCGQQVNSWDARCSKALAYKNKHCEKCIADEYDMNKEELRAKLEDFFCIRPCVGI